MKKIPMTFRGVKKLEEELSYLKRVLRPQIIRNIVAAREYGDLKENAEYHAAKEQQGFCEGRIKEIEYKLANAQVVSVTKCRGNGKVIFGSTVSVNNLSINTCYTYHIVGDDEANFKEKLISINSPIARGLIGHKEGDIVTISTPKGDIEYQILKVEYLN